MCGCLVDDSLIEDSEMQPEPSSLVSCVMTHAHTQPYSPDRRPWRLPPGPSTVLLPHTAPYTPCVPTTLRLVRSFVSDSVAYLRGLVSPWELTAALFLHRDKMLTKVGGLGGWGGWWW